MLRWRALLMTMTALTAQACAAEPARGGNYTVGVENLRYFPLHTIGPDQQYAGFAREVLDAFARRQGYTFRYVPLPINRLYAALLSERTVDFKYPDNPKWRQELRQGAHVSYSEVVVTTEEGAMVLPHKLGRRLGQIKTMGTVLGFTPWPYQAEIDGKAIALTTSGNLDGLLRLALAGHIDAVYVNVDVAKHMLANEMKSPGRLRFDPGLPHARSDFRLSTLRHPEVVRQFSQFLRRERNWLRQLRVKYKIGEAG